MPSHGGWAPSLSRPATVLAPGPGSEPRRRAAASGSLILGVDRRSPQKREKITKRKQQVYRVSGIGHRSPRRVADGRRCVMPMARYLVTQSQLNPNDLPALITSNASQNGTVSYFPTLHFVWYTHAYVQLRSRLTSVRGQSGQTPGRAREAAPPWSGPATTGPDHHGGLDHNPETKTAPATGPGRRKGRKHPGTLDNSLIRHVPEPRPRPSGKHLTMRSPGPDSHAGNGP
ncbi:predicted protein [Streptomyces sp. AA4]|nr:predicted protein [Streptomyces sp. AA4]